MIYAQIEIEGKQIENPLSSIVKAVSVNEQDAVAILQTWVEDYDKLSKIVSKVEKGSKETLEKLCKELNGHNLDTVVTDLFDINFGSILATVVMRDEKLSLLDNIEGYFDGDIKKLCSEEDYTEYPIEVSIETSKVALKKYLPC